MSISHNNKYRYLVFFFFFILSNSFESLFLNKSPKVRTRSSIWPEIKSYHQCSSSFYWNWIITCLEANKREKKNSHQLNEKKRKENNCICQYTNCNISGIPRFNNINHQYSRQQSILQRYPHIKHSCLIKFNINN